MLIARLLVVFLALVLCMDTGVMAQQEWAAQSRTALIIGNADYESAPLNNPVNDAQDIAHALSNLGFSVILKTNANQRTMERAIRDFGKVLREGGIGLFYFAGHGVQVRGNNYLVPVGAEIESEGDVKYEAVDAGLILAKMEDAANGLNIIILDACRNNPFSRSFRSAERGLAKMDAPTGSILAYSTSPGSVAADGTGRNGLYTEMLLKHIRTPDIDLPHLFMRVRRDVITATSKKQVPWESSSLIGDFYFNPQRGIAVTSNPPAANLKKNSSQKANPPVIANVPPSPKVNTVPQTRLNRVAILPFVFDLGGRYLKERLLTSTIGAFHSRDFSVDWSYYKMRKFRSIKKIDANMFSSVKIGQIWDKKPVLLKSQLDAELVYQIGKNLDADVVVVGITDIETADGQWAQGVIKLYIIDVVNRKVYSKKISPSNRWIHSPEFMSNYESSLKRLIDDILS